MTEKERQSRRISQTKYHHSPRGQKVRKKYVQRPEVKALHIIQNRRRNQRNRYCDRHHITFERFKELLKQQRNRCAACKEKLDCSFLKSKKIRRPIIDHDHKCCPGARSCGKCIRGIIHGNCNLAIGMLKDNPVKFQAISDYLRGNYVI